MTGIAPQAVIAKLGPRSLPVEGDLLLPHNDGIRSTQRLGQGVLEHTDLVRRRPDADERITARTRPAGELSMPTGL
ncbi:hypothetical protein AB0B45_23980 [Nonomuraea sp. NPDC049152]|uniref:hypothetical protein n=1 Tax=Nonomuraea sp. NPDC049152 TaxID=3154350 RepID=UPI003410F5FC